MIKRKGMFFIGLFLFLFVVLYINNVQSLGEGIEGVEGDAKKILNATTTLKKFTEEDKWEFLGKQWKEFILRNAFIAGIDAFLRNINIVFRFIFSQDYDLSLTFFVSVFLLLYFFFAIGGIIKSYSAFSPTTSYVTGFGLTLILAHTKLFKLLAELFIWLIFGDKPWWVSLILSVFLAGILVVVYILRRNVQKMLIQSRENNERDRREMKLRMGEQAAESLSTAAKSLSEGES